MPKTVLIVDDNQINRILLKKILISDYAIIEAENGKEALDFLLSKPTTVSAVLLDIIMPVMDGHAVLREMQKNPTLSQIPVIVITGDTTPETERKALTLGANDFVPKPFDAEIIKRRLDNLILLRETSAMVNTLQRDRLTGIWNRETFFQKAAWEIKRKPEGYFVLGCVDINNFKVVNDQYGTKKGDLILKKLADNLRESCDKNNGICGRITADDFIGLYPAHLLQEGVIDPLLLKKGFEEIITMPITLSVGRYLVEDKSLAISAMYDRACIAQNTVKGRYDNNIAVYNETMRDRLVREQEITAEMNAALKEKQFEAWFQPQYNHSTGALIGAEALARWRHPKWGLVSPLEFIPVFERNGFVYELDKCIWEEACAYLRKWIDEGRNPLPVSVNISRYDLFRADLVEVIVNLIQKYRLTENLLCLEITESAFAESTEQVVEVVKQLISYGFTVEIDDFGSGYSSLNTLKDVPAQILKLDMRFMEDSNDNERGGNIIESIVRMAKWLGMSVIAEGVEHKSQADYLHSIGCNYIQGYFYAKPMMAAEYESLAKGFSKEEHLLTLETVENLDNNAFWNPKSLDTLIFNSYVGAACIFEFEKNKIEMIRATKKFTRIIGNANLGIDDVLKLNWNQHLDEEGIRAINTAIQLSLKTKDEVTSEFVFYDLPGCAKETHLRSTLRVIANVGSRCLVYCTNENITAQREAELKEREAEQKEREAAARLACIMANIDGGVSAVTIDDDGTVSFVFANDRYYSILGYTREQFNKEVKNAADIVYHQDRAEIMKRAAEVTEKQRNDSYEYRCIKRNGDIVWLRCNATFTSVENLGDKVQLSVITDITERKKIEETIRNADDQLRFLNDISHDLLAQPEIEASIHSVLRKILTYFDADRAYIFELNEKKQISKNTYEVCASGVTAEIENLQEVPFSAQEFWINRFKQNEYINIEDVSTLPPNRSAEREILEAQGIKSLIAVAFYRDAKLIGFIGLDDPSCHREQAGRLRALGDYLAVMLTRRDLTKKIENDSKAVQTLMDDTPGGFAQMKMRPDGTSQTVFANSGFCKMMGMTKEELLTTYQSDVMVGVHPDDVALVTSNIKKAIEGDGRMKARYRLRRKDGSYFRVQLFARFTEADNGDIIINAYYGDLSIGERQELSVEETMPYILSAIMKSSPDLAFAKDKNFNFICCSPGFVKFARQKTEDDVIGKNDYDFWTKEEADHFRADDQKLFESGESLINYIEEIPSDDGITHYSNTSKYILRDNNGEIVGLYGCGQDITESRSTMERLKLLTDNIPGGIAAYAISPDNIKITYFNDGFCKMIGCTRQEYEELAKTSVVSRVFPEDMPKLNRQIQAIREKGTPIDCVYRNYRVDGNGYVWINIRAELYERKGDTAYINAILYDVTALHEAKQNEHKLSQQLSAIMANINGGISATIVDDDYNLHCVFTNEQYYDMLGYTKKQFEAELKNGFADIIHPDDCEMVLALAKSNEATRADSNIEFRAFRRDGSMIWLRSRGSICSLAGYDMPVHISVISNITEQIKANEALRISETEYRLAIEGRDKVIYRYNHKDNSVDLPESGAHIFGPNNHLTDVPESLIKYSHVADESKKTYRAFFEAIKQGEKTGSMTIRRQVTPGGWRWYSGYFSNIFDESGKPISAIIVFQDVTEEREKETVYRKWLQSLEEKSEDSYTLFHWNISQDETFDIREGSLLSFESPSCMPFKERIKKYAEQNVYSKDREAYVGFIDGDTILNNHRKGERTSVLEYRELQNDGGVRWLRVTIESVEAPNSTDVEAYIMYENIDKSKKADILVHKQAEIDPLTGVLNRVTFIAKMDQMIKEAKPDMECTVLMLDIDGFKLLNDTFGHAAGDRALIDIAETLRSIMRPDDLLGRLGGDEFLLCLKDMANAKSIQSKAKQICSLLHKSFSPDVQITASIGMAVYPRDGMDFDTLYRKADLALYAVKSSGKNYFAFYQPSMEQKDFSLSKTEIDENLSAPQNRHSKQRMLIVDDNKINTEVLATIFKDEFIIDRAADGNSALRLLRHLSSAISVVLLDLLMPDIDGFEVLKQMHNSELLRNIPVIVVSGSENREDILKVIRSGAFDFVSKPVDPDIIRIRVHSAISRAENEQLRAQNSLLTVKNNEVAKYQAVLRGTGTIVVEHNWKTGVFTYDSTISRYIAGDFDERKLWHILLSDFVADVKDVKALQELEHDVADDRARSGDGIAVTLKTPSGQKHRFQVSIVKLANEFRLTEKMLLCFTDLEGEFKG